MTPHKSSFIQVSKAVILGMLITFSLNYLVAAPWEPPTANPPLNNASGPIHEGASSQTKQGALRVGGLTSDTGIFVPTAAVPPGLAANVLLWVGGKALVDDVCLNTNSDTSCLSQAVKQIFAGRAEMGVGIQKCHPTGGLCGSSGARTLLGMPMPIGMTLKNLRVVTAATGACQYRILKQTACAGSFVATSLLCSIASTASCSNTTSSAVFSAGDCAQLEIAPTTGTCPTDASWSFEGNF